jgi:spore coat protein U-like protein
MNTRHSAKWVFSALALAGIGATSTALAATAVTGLAVSATVLATCVAAATPVVFGNYTLTALDTTGLITVTCTPDVLAYTVAIDGGTGSGATTSARKLSFGLNTLNYALYLDGSRTQNWGNTQNTDTLAASAATTTVGAVKTFTVYGRLPANQTSAAGVYSDTVQVTVTY